MADGYKTGGRQVGTPNKSTAKVREAIALFIDGNVDRLNGWLDAIAEKEPREAFKCFMDVVEYHIPKLARTELTNDEDGKFKIEVTMNVKGRPNDTGSVLPTIGA